MVALDIKEVPGSCGSCPLRAVALDAYVEWCPCLDKEIKDGTKKLRGCPIKGKVNESDVIKENKGN